MNKSIEGVKYSLFFIWQESGLIQVYGFIRTRIPEESVPPHIPAGSTRGARRPADSEKTRISLLQFSKNRRKKNFKKFMKNFKKSLDSYQNVLYNVHSRNERHTKKILNLVRRYKIMKTVLEIKNALADNTTNYKAIYNTNVELSNIEKTSLLVYNELKQALNNKTQELLLDVCYEKSKVCDLLTYSLIDKNDNNRLLHIYAKLSNADNLHFDVCTSARKENRDDFIKKIESAKIKCVNQKARTTVIKASYDNITDMCKLIVAILSDVNKRKADAKSKADADKQKNA